MLYVFVCMGKTRVNNVFNIACMYIELFLTTQTTRCVAVAINRIVSHELAAEHVGSFSPLE